MNKELTKQIIKHVYTCLGISPLDKQQKKSILQKSYLLKKTLSFEGEQKNIWGIQFKVEEDKYLQVIVADCSQNNTPEYAMMVALKETPSYATYLCYEELAPSDLEVDRPLIACQIKDGLWTECNTYMQGSFLCGMERIRDLVTPFSKLEEESAIDHLISFIEFYQDRMEIENEGKES